MGEDEMMELLRVSEKDLTLGDLATPVKADVHGVTAGRDAQTRFDSSARTRIWKGWDAIEGAIAQPGQWERRSST